MQHFLAVFRMKHFRMILHGIQFLIRIFHCGYGAVFRMSRNLKAFRNFGYIIRMAHPHDFFFFQAFKDEGLRIHSCFRFAEFPLIRFFNSSAQKICHHLHAVA